MKKISVIIVIISLCSIHFAMSSSLLLPTQRSELEDYWIAFENFAQVQYAQDRLATDDDYQISRSEGSFRLNQCNSSFSFCVFAQQDQSNLHIKGKGDEIQGYYKQDDNTLLLGGSLQVDAGIGKISGSAAIDRNDLPKFVLNMDAEEWGQWFWSYQERDITEEFSVSGEINKIDKRFYSDDDNRRQSIDWGGRFKLSGIEVDFSWYELWQNNYTLARQQKYALSHDSGWYVYGSITESNRKKGLISDGDVQHSLDQWSFDAEQNVVGLGYQVFPNWRLGGTVEEVSSQHDAHVQCAGKDWGLSGVEQVSVCVLTVPFAKSHATADYRFTGLESQSAHNVFGGTVSLNQKLGLFEWSSYTRLVTGSIEETDNNAGEEWIWVPSIEWNRVFSRVEVTYAWRQVIPLSIFDSLDLSTSSKKSDAPSGSESGTNSDYSQSYKEDWLWPLQGGFHELSVIYRW